MTRPVKGRGYDNSGRAAAARETRRAVVRAAGELFAEQGYTGTTLTEIAARAGVSVQTVYAQFGNKPALVKQLFDEAIVGDDEPVPMADRPEVAAQLAEPDPHVRIRMQAVLVASVVPRIEVVERIMASAAEVDEGLRAMLAEAREGRMQGMRDMAGFYASRDELAVSREEAAQRISALMEPDLYRRTVLDHGWTHEQFAAWLGDLMAVSILKPKPVARRR